MNRTKPPPITNAKCTRLAYQDKYDESLKLYTEAIELQKQTSLVAIDYYSRSECYKALGDTAKAKADFDKAKALGFSV